MGMEVIRRGLAGTNFWTLLHGAFDAIGFDERYIERLGPAAENGRSKHIKDKVWGMMEFRPDELAIIDCPLVQRLRRVRQLGLTYLTYPSAEHSRFVHTLGVTHVVKRLIRSISDAAHTEGSVRAGGQTYPLFDPDVKSNLPVTRALVHAALLHDVGHFAFSHAGEAAFVDRSHERPTLVGGIELPDFMELFREAAFDSGLSECMSMAICLSPRFGQFYAKVTASSASDERIDRICSFIGGVAVDAEHAGLANIISGAAVDADKIDYLNRDATECGIPVGVDVSRIFLSTSLVRISKTQADVLLKSPSKSSQNRFQDGYHFIVNSSGIDTYDELANAKSVLYQRVYLHQLTRNAEQVLAAALSEEMARVPGATDVMHWFPLGDDELTARLVHSGAGRRLVSRELPKRAFAIYRDACEPYVGLSDLFASRAWDGPDATGRLAELETIYARQTAWRLFDQIVPVDPSERPQRLSELVAQVRIAAAEAKRLLDPDGSPQDPNPYLGFSPRHLLKAVQEVLVREKNSIGYSSRWTKSEELTMAETVGRGIDYFHADPEWIKWVTIACTKVLNDFGVDKRKYAIVENIKDDAIKFETLPRLNFNLQDICSRIGADYRSTLEEMREAGRRGFFGSKIRIVPLNVDELVTCDQVAERYARFEGERGWHISAGLVAGFVRQFPVNLRAEILEVLINGVFVDRGTISSTFAPMIREFASETGASTVIIYRFSHNSGAKTQSLFEQECRSQFPGPKFHFARGIGEIEQRLELDPSAATIFVDDQFASGSQGTAQLLQWAGKPRKDWPSSVRDEKNITTEVLGPRAIEAFGTGNVALGFVYGSKIGQANLEETAGSVGFNGLKVIFRHDIASAKPKMSMDLTGYLADVGRQLLRRVRHPHHDAAVALAADAEQALRADALGYGGHGSVMTTESGGPTHSLTALWCPGIYNGEPWLPLFLRRGYRKHIVLG